MFRYLREYRFSITLILLLLIPVFAIDTATRAPREYRFHDKAVLFVTAPIQGAISWTLEYATSAFENYIYLWNTRKEHQKMIEENRKLLGKIASLREMQQENTRLRKLLDFNSNHQLESVIARVIAKDVSSEFRAIRINRGETSGVRKNMAVITDEGVVGRVLRTTRTTADVVTMLDLLSAVDSIVERSRARGVVEGMTDEVCQLKFIIRTDDIEPGDLLITSGLGGIYPKGIPVGTVSKANRKAYGISQEVEVRPSVDFSRLEEVMVVTTTGLGPSTQFDEALEQMTSEDPKEEKSSLPTPTPSPAASTKPSQPPGAEKT
jgi:rod shape-determining protein MreC